MCNNVLHFLKKVMDLLTIGLYRVVDGFLKVWGPLFQVTHTNCLYRYQCLILLCLNKLLTSGINFPTEYKWVKAVENFFPRIYKSFLQTKCMYIFNPNVTQSSPFSPSPIMWHKELDCRKYCGSGGLIKLASPAGKCLRTWLVCRAKGVSREPSRLWLLSKAWEAAGLLSKPGALLGQAPEWRRRALSG